MNGAEHALRTAADAGVDVCFANPGTTEMQLVAALDAVPRMRAVLGLFEGVVTGAADGYGRMAGRPALTLLHLGPGLANGLANLHNARRARTPVVNLVGDHARWHRWTDAPLTSDIETLARPMSAWVRTTRHAGEVAADCAEAIEAALRPPGQVTTLIVPQDCAWGDVGDAPLPAVRPPAPLAPPPEAVAAAERALRDQGPVLFLGGGALSERGLRAAAAVARATGCRLLAETFSARGERGAGLPAVERLPYFPEQARQALSGTGALVLAGARDPVSFFGYRGQPSRLAPPEAAVAVLAEPEEDAAGALEALAATVGTAGTATAAGGSGLDRPRPQPPTGGLTPDALGQALAAVQPEGSIVVEEGATTGLAYPAHAAAAPPHTFLGLTGGSIGQGLPTAVGAAVASPERPVVALQADGSGMYTVQALWTMAREGLDVTVLVCANRAYRILQAELLRAGVSEPGPTAVGLTDLGRPPLDWVALARGMGVPGTRAETADALVEHLRRALAESGPALVEAVL